jgi:hypothetical protein
MANPDCQAKYQQHIAQGGRLSYPQFAYQYAATGGFSAQGMANYRQSESANQQREAAAAQGLRQAQAARGQAQQQYAAGYARNQAEAGEVLRGNSSWVDPGNGQQRALPYMGPNGGYQDPRGCILPHDQDDRTSHPQERQNRRDLCHRAVRTAVADRRPGRQADRQ